VIDSLNKIIWELVSPHDTVTPENIDVSRSIIIQKVYSNDNTTLS